jgi:hypothetical protein
VKQIVALGCSYFFFAAAYGVTHTIGQTESKESKTELLVVVPLSVLDAAVCWWIFLSLRHTLKVLELRNNTTKLQLYLRFRWALAASILATLVFGVWYFYQHFGRAAGEYAWQTAWMEDAYLHLLFYGIMLVIMYLWRPSANNSRYAYAAIENDGLDNDDNDGPHAATATAVVVPHYTADAMKLRSFASRGVEPPPRRADTVEDDLDWVEANIPSAAAGAAGAGTGTGAATMAPGVVAGTADAMFPSFPMDSDEVRMGYY